MQINRIRKCILVTFNSWVTYIQKYSHNCYTINKFHSILETSIGTVNVHEVTFQRVPVIQSWLCKCSIEIGSQYKYVVQIAHSDQLLPYKTRFFDILLFG